MLNYLVDRRNTNSAKWEESVAETQSTDVIPLSVAEMDFQAPSAVRQKLSDAVEHGIYGYTNLSGTFYDAVQSWMMDNYGWNVQREWIVFCPRIIQAVSLIIQNFTIEGDKVVIQSPLYSPLTNAIELNNRTVVKSPLIYKDKSYKMDFADLERQFRLGSKIMILCSPHNPTGRVWCEEELIKLTRLCKRYNVLLISDEVHADFTFGTHISAGSIKEIKDNVVVCTSPAKTFNLPGLEVSNIIIPNKVIREKFEMGLRKTGFLNPNYFAVPALVEAYLHGGEWLSKVKEYIKGNREYVKEFLAKYFPSIEVVHSEGTFLMWLDCRRLNLDETILKEWLFQHANVVVSMGSSFGSEGRGFIRINIGTPRKQLKTALERIRTSYSWVINREGNR